MTLATLTSGLVGSLLAALATFTAALIAVAAGRRRDRQRDEVQRASRHQEMQREVVAGVIGTLAALEKEMRWAPMLRGHSSAKVLEAVMRFYLSMNADHPRVADWLLDQYRVYHETVERWHRRWWIGFGRGQLAEELGTTLGELTAVLVAWASRQLDDSEFTVGRSARDVLSHSIVGAPEH